MRLALPLLLVATPALAETGYSCAFTVACAAPGDCEAIEELTEIATSEAGEWIFLGATAAALPAFRLPGREGGAEVFATNGAGGTGTRITVNPDRTALLSRHRDAVGAATLFGTCEVM